MKTTINVTKLTIFFVFLVNSLLFANDFECNKTKINEWIQKRMQLNKTVSYSEISQLPKCFHKPVYLALTKSNQVDIWIEKLSILNNLNVWTEIQKTKLKSLNLVFKFSADRSSKIKQSFLTHYLDKWVRDCLYNQIFTKNQLIKLVASLEMYDGRQNNKFESTAVYNDCQCNIDHDFCSPNPVEPLSICKSCDCDESEKGCGWFWFQECNGRCEYSQ